MPSYYTNGVGRGEVTFAQFAERCTREYRERMGFCDSSMANEEAKRDAHLKECQLAIQRYDSILGWSETEADQLAQQAYQNQIKNHRDTLANLAAHREHYQAMLTEVQAWTPPTEDHEWLKAFMTDALEKSIEADCTIAHVAEPIHLTGAQYKQQMLMESLREIKHYSEEVAAAIKRVQAGTDWFEALYRSLGLDPDVTKS